MKILDFEEKQIINRIIDLSSELDLLIDSTFIHSEYVSKLIREYVIRIKVNITYLQELNKDYIDLLNNYVRENFIDWLQDIIYQY